MVQGSFKMERYSNLFANNDHLLTNYSCVLSGVQRFDCIYFSDYGTFWFQSPCQDFSFTARISIT